MADSTERLPFPLSSRLQGEINSLSGRNGAEIHYAVAGVPFRTQISGELPMTIATAAAQKEQQDTEPEAGEQTLGAWWYRSQASWHEGAGARYAESRGEVKDTSRFWQSSNMDVWTPGELKLLRRGQAVTSTVNLSVATVPVTGVNSVVVGQDGAVRRYTDLDVGTATIDLYVNAAVRFTNVIATRNYWFAAGNDQKVYSGPIGGPTTTPDVWSLTAAPSGSVTRIIWAKHRLWAVSGHYIYVINYAAPGTVASPAATTHVYKHPSSAWVYTDLCDAPAGVLFSGHGDGSSGLQRITLDSDGGSPTLSGAMVTAVLPSDERALRISSLASSLVCIVTNLGVRVAAVQGDEMVYGPLFMGRAELSTTATPSVVSAGRWWWLCWGDEPKVWRIDSSVEVEEGVFAYASDLESGVSNYSDISARSERPVVVTAAGGLVYRHATQLEATGYIESGRIRYRTDEPKAYRYIDVSAAPLAGSLAVTLITDTSTERQVLVHNTPGLGRLPSAEFPIDLGTQRFIAVRLTFNRAAGLTTGPLVQGVLVKAVPAVRPQRLITIPLACFDREKWSTGQEDGYDGFARDRYLALRDVEDAGGVCAFQDFTFEPPTSEAVVIEEMKFVRVTQPDMEKFNSSYGGILLLTLRTLS